MNKILSVTQDTSISLASERDLNGSVSFPETTTGGTAYSSLLSLYYIITEQHLHIAPATCPLAFRKQRPSLRQVHQPRSHRKAGMMTALVLTLVALLAVCQGAVNVHV